MAIAIPESLCPKAATLKSTRLAAARSGDLAQNSKGHTNSGIAVKPLSPSGPCGTAEQLAEKLTLRALSRAEAREGMKKQSTYSARLKSCPVTKHLAGTFSVSCEVVP